MVETHAAAWHEVRWRRAPDGAWTRVLVAASTDLSAACIDGASDRDVPFGEPADRLACSVVEMPNPTQTGSVKRLAQARDRLRKFRRHVGSEPGHATTADEIDEPAAVCAATPACARAAWSARQGARNRAARCLTIKLSTGSAPTGRSVTSTSCAFRRRRRAVQHGRSGGEQRAGDT